MGSALDRLIAGQQSSSGTPPSALDALIAKQKGGVSSGPLDQIEHGLEQSYSAIRHPIDAVSAIAHGIRQSAADMLTPAVGSYDTYGGPSVSGWDKQGHPTYGGKLITKENTPDAISPGQHARGEINTLANIALPGVGGEVSSHLINAGLGAINDPQEPLRGATAGLLIGAALHHAPKLLHGATDISEGMVPRDLESDAKYQEQVNPITPLAPKYEGQKIDVNPKTNALTVADESGEVPPPARRPAYILPKNQQPPVEPSASAEGQTFGKTPLTDLTPEQIALRSRLALEHGIPEAAIDDITRRAMNVKPPVEPPEDAATVSAGGRVGRRPAGEIAAPESPTAGFDDLIPGKTNAAGVDSPAVTPPAAKIHEDTGLPLNDDGTVTLYHHTSPESAASIQKTGRLKSNGEPDVYLTTQKEPTTGYGDASVPLRVNPDKLQIDDEFPNGRKDFRLPLDKPGGSVRVTPDKLPTNGSNDEEAPTGRLATPVSYDAFGKLDDVHPRLEPIVSSNGNFDARPGVLNRVNKDFTNLTPASPSRIVMPQRYAPGETASIAPAEAQAAPEPLASTPKNVSADELINRSKLDLDPNGEKAFQAETERAKAAGLDKTKVSFETQRAAASDFAKSINMDPKTLDPNKMGRLSGAQIVGLKNVLSKNLNDMGEASKKLADPDISVADAEKLNDHLDGLRTQNDALMSKIVSETSEKGRDLGFLRQMSNATLDPDVWAVQARKMAGRMLSDDEIATVQGLAKAAADACAGGA